MLLVKLTLVSVGAELDAREPRRCPAHLLTDRLQAHIRAAFDDQLVMHVPDDLAIAQSPHGIGQDVPADGLHDVLHELRAVALDPGPMLCGVDAHVGDGLAAETVLADPGLDIGQLPAGGQRDEQHAFSHHEGDITDMGLRPKRDRILDGSIDLPPVLRYMRIAAPPHIHQRLKLLLGQAHVQSAHCPQRSRAAAIAQCQLGNFPFLPEMRVLAMLLNRYTKHSAGALAVNITAIAENIYTPLFPGKVTEHAGLDRAEIANDEFVSRPRNERGPDQLRQHAGHTIVKGIQHLIVTGFHQFPRLLQVGEMVLRKILQLNQPSCPAATSIRTVKLEHAVATAIGADGILHRLVFPNAALGELQPELQYLCQGFEELSDEIDALREEKQDLLVEEANRAGMKQRLDELEAFLADQTTEVTEYDEGLVRQLIEKITVYDDHLAFEFKSGLETEVQM